MITEDYCSYEVAKLLKEKGFEQHKCQHSYDSKGVFKWSDDLDPYECSAPTHQTAMKWLREEKNIFIIIEPHVYDYVNEKNKSYTCSLWIGDKYYEYEYLEPRDYPSYEEAVEAALKYCLKNLI